MSSATETTETTENNKSFETQLGLAKKEFKERRYSEAADMCSALLTAM